MAWRPVYTIGSESRLFGTRKKRRKYYSSYKSSWFDSPLEKYKGALGAEHRIVVLKGRPQMRRQNREYLAPTYFFNSFLPSLGHVNWFSTTVNENNHLMRHPHPSWRVNSHMWVPSRTVSHVPLHRFKSPVNLRCDKANGYIWAAYPSYFQKVQTGVKTRPCEETEWH